jgi:hypothetical protein
MKPRVVHGVLLAGLLVGVLGLLIHPDVKSSLKPPAAARSPTAFPLHEVTTAISGLDLARAERLLRELPANSSSLPLLRARLALYRGDCDEARAILSSVGTSEAAPTRDVLELAEGCARAVAGSRIVVDEARGVWVRIQDDADESWVQGIIDVAARARDATAAKLGIPLPRPLRIELVLDHASLSALTGLPLEAAETTGTVAVARWGRVSMLSPRSFARGYPWQDTLAHEITHLLVTAATYDNAPLWLQEALAKHFETAWRPARPLDNVPDPHELTLVAWQTGRSVGIENLGASIALLPSPESARIAYAEVTDLLEFILRRSGWQALRLLVHEMRVLGADRVDEALVSATGYTQKEWSLRWRAALSGEKLTAISSAHELNGFVSEADVEIAQRARLAELLVSRAAWAAIEPVLSEHGGTQLDNPELRAMAGLAKLQLDEPDAALRALGTTDGLASLQGDWLALRGRALAELRNLPDAKIYFDWAFAYAPTSERVCCEGHSQLDGQTEMHQESWANLKHKPLCLAARSLAMWAGPRPID